VRLRCSSHSRLRRKTTTSPMLHAQQLLDRSHMPPVFVMGSFGQCHQLPSWLAAQVVAQHTNIHCQVHVMSTATNTLNISLSFLLSSLRGRQLLSCLALRPQIGPNALPLTNQNPTTKVKGYILLKKGKRKSKKHYPSYIKE